MDIYHGGPTELFLLPASAPGNVLFNDTLNTFYLRLVREETRCSFRLGARVLF